MEEYIPTAQSVTDPSYGGPRLYIEYLGVCWVDKRYEFAPQIPRQLFKDDTAESVADPSYGTEMFPKTNERLEPMSNLRRFVLANTYFPGPSPAKYLRHDRA